ncbi:MAG TPA: nicotinate-nucleotide adenylyltransferase [Longimicrobiales bacterium]|nr:nicotinate-nucleotide adenylyltransferase [Longimicrobiales bacterium]
MGVLGGTFDPPHLGHLVVAQDVAEALDLDEVRFVVAARPPLKPDRQPAPGEVRAAMVEAAVAGNPRFRLSRIELDRGGASYTVDTVRALREAEPGVEWFVVIGADQLAQLTEWREPEALGRLARLVVVSRRGHTPGPSGAGGSSVPWRSVEVTRIDVSSTEVRGRVAAGRSVRYLVPETVRRIIEERGLYREARAVVPGR